MYYSISDFYNTFRQGLKIIAGAGGMSRPIVDAGILDYELEPALKDKYFHSNFHENQLIVTTFLYARENSFLMIDAVKHLIAKGASGLVIKNVFHIPIHDSILRYADSKDFPVFITTSQDVYVENIIYEVTRHSELLSDLNFSNRELNLILSQDYTDAEIRQHAKAINPSFGDQLFHVFLQFDEFFNIASFQQCCQMFCRSDLNQTGNSLIYYDHGVLFTCSQDDATALFSDAAIAHTLEILTKGGNFLSAGVSDCHLKLEEFKASVLESLYASSIRDGEPYLMFGKLGTYRLLFPFCKTQEMRKFSADLLNPILDYDIENNTHLLDTLRRFIDLDCNLGDTALSLCQHRNTIRYRLDKISEITGLDYKKFSHMEQLSLAIKILRCTEKKPL